MIILDTNVVSEPMKANGAPSVADWLDRQAAETLYLTAVNLAELLVGVETMPAGKRREGVGAALAALIAELFGARILPFDEDAARAYAALVARARAKGVALSVADAQIAAIATVRGFVVATRDTAPFVAAGVPIIDPWRA
ncbi:MAG: type II toxin-antitoxin system VapC family toxin [Roseiarcus sp.]